MRGCVRLLVGWGLGLGLGLEVACKGSGNVATEDEALEAGKCALAVDGVEAEGVSGDLPRTWGASGVDEPGGEADGVALKKVRAGIVVNAEISG